MDTFVQRFLFNLCEIQDCLVNMERVQLLTGQVAMFQAASSH